MEPANLPATMTPVCVRTMVPLMFWVLLEYSHSLVSPVFQVMIQVAEGGPARKSRHEAATKVAREALRKAYGLLPGRVPGSLREAGKPGEALLEAESQGYAPLWPISDQRLGLSTIVASYSQFLPFA